MKKARFIAFIIVALLALELVSCGEAKDQSDDKEISSGNISSAKNNFIVISTTDFVDNFSENASGVVNLYFARDFSEDEYDIHEYKVDENTITSGCIIDISYDSDDNIRQVLLQSRPSDAFTYGYATWTILGIAPDVDCETILSELNITEDGSQKDGTYSSSQNWGNLIFNQTGTICTLNIILE